MAKDATLRAYLAAKAMQGLLANPGGPIQASGMSGWGFTNCEAEHVARLAVGMADLLIAELNKPARDAKEGTNE